MGYRIQIWAHARGQVAIVSLPDHHVWSGANVWAAPCVGSILGVLLLPDLAELAHIVTKGEKSCKQAGGRFQLQNRSIDKKT